MKLFVGLGNPGHQYVHTRHNVGFMLIDVLSHELKIALDKSKFQGLYGTKIIEGEKIILLKPLTYMNLSGNCVYTLANYYKIALEDIIIIYDDLDLKLGKIRLRQKGSAGGHNGIRSIISKFGSEDILRIKIGIGRPKEKIVTSDFVLSEFHHDEHETIRASIVTATEICKKSLNNSFIHLMNTYNKK